MEPITNNMQKYENYREQMGRLSKSMKAGFYLEAIFIEYALMEDRTQSVLIHSKVFNEKKHNTLARKIGKISDMGREKKGLANKYFSEELLSDMKTWMDSRNVLIHALLKQSMHTEDLIEIAEEGQRIVKILNNKTTCYKRALEKKAQEEEK